MRECLDEAGQRGFGGTVGYPTLECGGFVACGGENDDFSEGDVRGVCCAGVAEGGEAELALWHQR